MAQAHHLRAVSSVVLLPATVFAAGLAAGSSLLSAAGAGVADGTWTAWLALQLAVILAGLVGAGVVGSRRLSLADGRLCYASLRRRLCWPETAIEAITYDAHPRLSLHARITLHGSDGRQLGLNVYLWRQTEVAGVLRALMAVNPGLELTPAAYGYLARVY